MYIKETAGSRDLDYYRDIKLVYSEIKKINKHSDKKHRVLWKER